MPYVALNDVTAVIPPQFLTQGLDDDGDGIADAGIFDLIAAQASDAVDLRLGQRYATPFTDPIPAVVKQAALIFAAEAVYGHRVPIDQNPWVAQGNSMRSKLDKMGAGEIPLTPELQRQLPSVSIISERSRTASRHGRTAV